MHNDEQCLLRLTHGGMGSQHSCRYNTTTINVNDKFRIIPSPYLYIRFGWIAIREALFPLKLAEVVAKWLE